MRMERERTRSDRLLPPRSGFPGETGFSHCRGIRNTRGSTAATGIQGLDPFFEMLDVVTKTPRDLQRAPEHLIIPRFLPTIQASHYNKAFVRTA